MAELVGFAPVKDGGGTRATNPGPEVTREGATRLYPRSNWWGYSRDSWRNFGIIGCIVDPALSDLVGDRTQSGAVLGYSIFSNDLRFCRSALTFAVGRPDSSKSRIVDRSVNGDLGGLESSFWVGFARSFVPQRRS